MSEIRDSAELEADIRFDERNKHLVRHLCEMRTMGEVARSAGYKEGFHDGRMSLPRWLRWLAWAA